MPSISIGYIIFRCLTHSTPKPNIYVSIGVYQGRKFTLNQSLIEEKSGDRAAYIVDNGRGEVLLAV